MSKSAIEQADEIVGIATDVIMANVKADTYRRGAYADWFRKNSQPDMWPTVAEVLSSQAERIVRLHAASKPKGDGLPDDWQVRVVGTAAWCVRVSPSNDAVGFERSTADAVAKHLSRCLAPPVRRLLAAFEVVDGPYSSGVWFVVTKDGRIHTVNDIAYGAYVLTDVVCSLVPKGAK